MQFRQTRIFFRKNPKVTKWFIELQKKVPKKVPLDSQHAVNETQPNQFYQRPKVFRSKSENDKISPRT